MPSDPADIHEHMIVVGSDGQHIGVVDKVEGHWIKLTKSDPLANNQHHYIDLAAVDHIEKPRVWLRQPAQQIMQHW